MIVSSFLRAIARLGLAAALAGGLAACGGAGETAQKQTINRAAAAKLALEANSVANSLELGNACGARRQLVRLKRDAKTAISAGRVPPALGRPLLARVTSLASRVVCTPSTRQPKHERGKHKGKKGKHKGKGGGEDD